jgi:Fe2+ or Zn2+ uptake regulation protein
VSELTQKNFSSYFAKQSEQADFKYAKHNLEIFGVCRDCTK